MACGWSSACPGVLSCLCQALGLSSSSARWTLVPCLAPASQPGLSLAWSCQLGLAWLWAAAASGSVGACCGVSEVGIADLHLKKPQDNIENMLCRWWRMLFPAVNLRMCWLGQDHHQRTLTPAERSVVSRVQHITPAISFPGSPPWRQCLCRWPCHRQVYFSKLGNAKREQQPHPRHTKIHVGTIHKQWTTS